MFKSNLMRIHAHNTENHPFKVGMNEMGDLTEQEFRSRYLGYMPRRADYIRSLNTANLSTENLPASVDWRTKNVVTAIKNQGQCGSCWAFSTTGSTEGAHAIKTGKLVSLSEQQLVDCSDSFGNQGCNGGLMDQGFEYIIANKGLCTESAYPYTAQDGTCKSTTCSSAATISSYHDVTPQSDPAMEAAVVQQPVSIAIEADQFAFQFYTSGVIPASSCGSNLDHGVLTVGYGTDSTSGMDYYIVKNSWGASWGMKGYVNLQRGVGGTGTCGMLSVPSFPIV